MVTHHVCAEFRMFDIDFRVLNAIGKRSFDILDAHRLVVFAQGLNLFQEALANFGDTFLALAH